MEPQALFGRDRERREVAAFLDRLPEGLSGIALTGSAGIGKTTLWREGVRLAKSRGYLVLAARPGQAEQSLSFAGLADLIGPVPAEAFDSLTAVQRRAIDLALLRDDFNPDESSHPPGRAAAAAVLAVLRRLAAAGPVLIAVDDAQWLDQATAESLAFALRRVEPLPVGVLVSVRVAGGRTATFDASISADRRTDLAIGRLSVAALHAIVNQRISLPMPRPVLVRIVTSCGGNPFYAIEIARELERVGLPSPGEPLPVPGELQALVRSRTARLPARTRRALLVAACQSQPTIGTVDLEALTPAERDGIVAVERSGRLRFTHPLLAAAVQESAPAGLRLAVHRRLAEATGDAEERARHLAAVTTGPDETVACALDAAAERAASRGALTGAAALARRAIELSVDQSSERAIRRIIAFAEHSMLSGDDPAEAGALLDAALARCADGDLRAELRIRRAWMHDSPESRYLFLLKALDETSDRAIHARVHMQAVWLAESDVQHGLRHCEAALELIDEASDAGTYSSMIMHRAYLQLLAGAGADHAAIDRGKAIEARAVAAGLTDRSPVPIVWPMLNDDFTLAAVVHLEHLEWSRQVGQQPLELSLIYFLSLIELYRGNWDLAGQWASTLAEMVGQSGSSTYWWNALTCRGLLDAHAGRLEAAAAAGAEAISIADHAGREVEARQLLGFAAMWGGDLVGAVRQFVVADRLLDRLGQREPALLRFHPDLIEALIGLGDLDQARAHLARLAERARTLPRAWTLATSARCRGLLFAAEGDLEAAVAAMREALTEHERLEMPFERARTLLAYGQVLRRSNARQAARSALEEALAAFGQLGATVWADRAAAELSRVPPRRARAGLTPSEEEVARLAAAGYTNREIAARAFISTKTVEANLTRVYAKLGVRSRAQLSRVLADQPQNTG